MPLATIEIEGYGVMQAELYPHIAPNTVANFIDLANKGFYDGLKLHRIVNDFVLQGGDPEGTGIGGPGYRIKGEFVENGFKENNLSHQEGVLSMARSQDNDSAGSQFFIVTGPATPLDGKYAAFGKITQGYEVADALEKVAVGKGDKPLTDVIITSIRVDTKDISYSAPEIIE
ncbi:MAG: peptidylprolyl isomerase [Cellulosilyticaceae bacterium]